jgi:hypothetical protein
MKRDCPQTGHSAILGSTIRLHPGFFLHLYVFLLDSLNELPLINPFPTIHETHLNP